MVPLGVRLDGTKELIALAEGLRESTESWADLLRDCRRRGMRDPELVIGESAMGLWGPSPRCSPRPSRRDAGFTKPARHLPPAQIRPATKAMQEIYNAESRTHADKAIEAFARNYGAKFPNAVAKITEDRDELLAFYDFPAEHWIHLRTTKPIKSTFSAVELRTKVTRGAVSQAAGLAMVFKLVESAQARWRAITWAQLVPLVRAGAKFENGQLAARPKTTAA
ncbi:transposase [Streptomyces sp. NPDC001351]|uniref:transposase n=1 Tax=Streptomyces sp. NPDC001351 TaxID=3364564 RepID=UPI0036BAB22A